MSFFILLNTNEDILKNVGKQLMDPIDFHSIFSPYGSRVHQLSGIIFLSEEEINSYSFKTI